MASPETMPQKFSGTVTSPQGVNTTIVTQSGNYVVGLIQRVLAPPTGCPVLLWTGSGGGSSRLQEAPHVRQLAPAGCIRPMDYMFDNSP